MFISIVIPKIIRIFFCQICIFQVDSLESYKLSWDSLIQEYMVNSMECVHGKINILHEVSDWYQIMLIYSISVLNRVSHDAIWQNLHM